MTVRDLPAAAVFFPFRSEAGNHLSFVDGKKPASSLTQLVTVNSQIVSVKDYAFYFSHPIAESIAKKIQLYHYCNSERTLFITECVDRVELRRFLGGIISGEDSDKG